MRAIVFTEELMGVALKFTRKSTNMGSLLVSWDAAANCDDLIVGGIKQRKQFNRRVQATITLCLAMIFLTLFLFFLCALDSSSPASPLLIHQQWGRRRLESVSPPAPPPRRQPPPPPPPASAVARAAMGRLGVIFRRGTKSMSSIVVAHASEDLSPAELKLFMRMIHRSGVMAHADLVLLFPGDPLHLAGGALAAAVEQEDADFKQILAASGCFIRNGSNRSSEEPVRRSDCGGRCCGGELASNSSISTLNVAAYERARAESRARAAIRSNKSNSSSSQQQQQQMPVAWGSIMAFDAAELDPIDTLSGFIDRPPMQLRRWVCYQMLLGIARRRYKQVLATQIRGVFIASDSILFRNSTGKHRDDGRSLHLVEQDRSWLHERSTQPPAPPQRGRRRHGSGGGGGGAAAAGMIESVYGRSVWEAIDREDKAGWAIVSGAVVVGGVRGVRSLAEAMATEIARAAMLRRNRRPFGDAAALNYVLRRNVGVLGQKVVDQMAALGWRSGGVNSMAAGAAEEAFRDDSGRPYSIVIAEDSAAAADDLRSRLGKMVMQDLCSSPREAAIYGDCSSSSSSSSRNLQQR